MRESNLTTKPFLKWAGGKSQLLEQINHFLPAELKQGKLTRYIEPFIGSGAVFFSLAQGYHFQEFFISDINEELILAYRTIQTDVESLIEILSQIQDHYFSLNELERKEYYYNLRSQFNYQRKNLDKIQRTAHLIFLNRTCFNGLFRVNARGEFNVPMGRYKNPLICNAENLKNIAKILQKTQIYCGNFTDCEAWVDSETFVYCDPPYKPISTTSSFTAYSQHDFADAEQLKLRDLFRQLDSKGVKIMLSNSDPQNEDPSNNFFTEAYQGYRIEKVKASRSINSNSQKRGQINELLIMNY